MSARVPLSGRIPLSAPILAVNTTGDHGSIALVEGQSVLEEIALHSPEGFAHILFDEIGRLLARHGVALMDIAAFAAASGPGSFTGVRIGLTAVKGLAEATGRQVVAVSNLQALASFGTRALRGTVIDARRGEIYGAVYDASLGVVREEVVTPLDSWLASLPAGDLEVVTNGCPIDPVQAGAPILEAPLVLAGAVGRIAAARLAAGEAQNPEEIDANYVRRSDAELLWKEPSRTV